ncbi:Phosphoribosylamine--glycine ligase [Clostridiaceae bacterium JG1575]|nr:Phosphoribosylamine--glycine ligase [Clostridiaceae bacterium JG1575]
MKVLLIGAGGREHALALHLAQSRLIEEVVVSPGNPGIASEAKCRIEAGERVEDWLALAQEEAVAFTVVGPEAPLVEGLGDVFRAAGLKVFGPGRAMAQLEGSKAFAKEFMKEYGVATAAYDTVKTLAEARQLAREKGAPLVVKASGLCAGKGVVVAQSEEDVQNALEDFMGEEIFGAAGRTVVLEECLEGPEVSILALYDGQDIYPMVSAMDHKRIGEGDVGPNTGGMGTLAPAPAFDAAAQEDFYEHILRPTQKGLLHRGFRDPACIFFGLMLTKKGVRLLEYNLRFGDPETQSVLALLEGDLGEIFLKALSGTLRSKDLTFKKQHAMTLIGAAPGYPGLYEKDLPLSFSKEQGIQVFHAGTRLNQGQLVSSGGRIFGVTATGEKKELHERLNRYMQDNAPAGVVWRRDIGAS